VEPEEANIVVSIQTDTRLTGTIRLAHLFHAFLVEKGYTNVKALPPEAANYNIPNHWDDARAGLDRCQRVSISIELPPCPSISN
jgi:hypothetical protein